MPYEDTSELPKQVKNALPKHAQDIYQAAFNNAYNQYSESKSRKSTAKEETAHRVAWSAVKKAGYQQKSNTKWHKP